VAGRLQHFAQHVADEGLVVDDQDAGHAEEPPVYGPGDLERCRMPDNISVCETGRQASG
jgi:hypothetical protein